ncbi:MAG TPA: hypothetical protein VGS19_25100 [Streptosporangiaceae bacterium]|nr:hypothetical protein [Streptosporangiaceae bacterium]
MKYLTIQEVTFADSASFGAGLDPLMDALLAIEANDGDVEDPDLVEDLSAGRIDVQMTVEAPDPAAAMVKALATLRAAIESLDAPHEWETTSAVMHAAPAEEPDRLLATDPG